MRKRQFGFKQDYLVVVGKVEEQGVLIRALTVVSEGKLINNTARLGLYEKQRDNGHKLL